MLLLPLALLGAAALGSCQAADGQDGRRTLLMPVTDNPRSVHYRPEPVPAPPADSKWRPSSPEPAPLFDEARELYPFKAGKNFWSPVGEGSSSGLAPVSGRARAATLQVDRFATLDGREHGPLPIGSSRFGATPYPLDIPLLSWLYRDDAWIPADFEHFLDANGHPNQWIYRPEPWIMRAVRRELHAMLDKAGLRPARIGVTRLHEGEYMWPPVNLREAKNGVELPRLQLQRITTGVRKELIRNKSLPGGYRLEVPMGSYSRYVLMTPLATGHFTTLAELDIGSEFWVFHEGMESRQGGAAQRTMALLGGMFLPLNVLPILSQGPFFRRAALHVAR